LFLTSLALCFLAPSLAASFFFFFHQISESPLTCVKVHPRENLLAVGSNDGVVTILQLSKGLYYLDDSQQKEERNNMIALFDREFNRESNLRSARQIREKKERPNNRNVPQTPSLGNTQSFSTTFNNLSTPSTPLTASSSSSTSSSTATPSVDKRKTVQDLPETSTLLLSEEDREVTEDDPKVQEELKLAESRFFETLQKSKEKEEKASSKDNKDEKSNSTTTKS
jgi:hypothetical protein